MQTSSLGNKIMVYSQSRSNSLFSQMDPLRETLPLIDSIRENMKQPACHKDHPVRTLKQCFGLLLSNAYSIQIFSKASASTEAVFRWPCTALLGLELGSDYFYHKGWALCLLYWSDLTYSPMVKPLSEVIQIPMKSNYEPNVWAWVGYLNTDLIQAFSSFVVTWNPANQTHWWHIGKSKLQPSHQVFSALNKSLKFLFLEKIFFLVQSFSG